MTLRLLLLACGVLLVGCEESSTAGSDQHCHCQDAGTAIGPDGGTARGIGASVDVPPGALSETVEIWIGAASAPASLPVDLVARTSTLEFRPLGQTFHVPVTITIEHSAASTSRLTVLRCDLYGESWHPVADAEFSATAAVVQTSSFSYYVVASPHKQP